jgi:two-component system, NarL family, response regulator
LEKNNPIRIMVVDDHFVVRIGLAATINVEPDMVVVAEAEDGLQAIAKFREHTPDITLMDLRLPGMSGVEAMEAIRRDFVQARIIVLSTYDGDEAISRALRSGAQAYLLKTALHDDLLKAIRAVHAGKKHIPVEIAERLAQRLPDSELSTRETEVLKLIARGMSNKEVAGALFITEGTVKFHVINILNKLSAKDRTMAVTIALQRGIIFL